MDAIENTTNQKKKAMTKDEIIMQLMDLLKENQMNQQANGVYEICSYVDGLQNKLDSMTEELSSMRKQIEEMQQDTVLNNLKKSLHEAADRLENRCNIIKGELFTVKATIHQKASDIVAETKKKGRVALNRVSEIFGIKDKLTKMKGNIEQGILDTDKTIAKIEAFGTGMRKANEQIVNTFRTFADKPEVDYATKEQKFSKTELAKKPWKWQKKVYQSMVAYLDGAIGKCEELSKRVELDRADRLPREEKQEMSPQNLTERERIVPVPNIISMVAEDTSVYGADLFEASVEAEKDKVTETKEQTKSKAERKEVKER